MSAGHARLAASSAHRWLNCAASISLSEGAPDDTSIYAATGTYAHAIAAKCLEKLDDPIMFLGSKAKVEGFDIECDQEMVDGVRRYMKSIRDDMQNGDRTWVEMSLHKALAAIDKDTGGTADFVRYRRATKSLRVWDFKYGSGKFVQADDNQQAMLYALGVLLEVNQPFEEVVVTIVQPRFEGAEPERSWTFPVSQIMEFVADVQEAANRTREKKPQIAAGDWCAFCKAARICPELEKRHHALAAAEFDKPVVDLKALAEALASVPLVKARITAIEEFAYKQACAGVEIPGYKLVNKIAHRKWKNQADVIEWAASAGVECYAPRELLSPAQIEEKLKEAAPRGTKKDAGKVLEPLVERISSGTALVTLADKRAPAKLVTAEDFALAGTDGTANK